MEDSLLKFNEQFNFQPEIVNSQKLKGNYKNFILAGMGGSHLAAGLFHIFRPGINLYIHKDYGLPPYEGSFMQESLLIASSYSGNTEEVVDFAAEAYAKGYDLAIITTGGKLLDFAKENELPYIVLPQTGIQPRTALGFSSLALASLVEPDLIPELQSLADVLGDESIREQAKELSEGLTSKIPIIYSSAQNKALSYIWKITMNETAKIESYFNIFPELNHNEMQSFEKDSQNIDVSRHFIIIHDSNDEPRIELRMKTTENLYQEQGHTVSSIFLEGESTTEKVFRSVLLANWTAFYIASSRGAEAEQVPLIEEFKKRIS